MAEAIKEIIADGGLHDLLEVLKSIRVPRDPGQARQASPDREPPRPEGRHEAGKGAEQRSGLDNQAGDDQPPTRPQSSGREEPRVKADGGTGPQRVDVGVPAEELGLLGLGGDTSFVDRPLV